MEDDHQPGTISLEEYLKIKNKILGEKEESREKKIEDEEIVDYESRMLCRQCFIKLPDFQLGWNYQGCYCINRNQGYFCSTDCYFSYSCKHTVCIKERLLKLVESPKNWPNHDIMHNLLDRVIKLM